MLGNGPVIKDLATPGGGKELLGNFKKHAHIVVKMQAIARGNRDRRKLAKRFKAFEAKNNMVADYKRSDVEQP